MGLRIGNAQTGKTRTRATEEPNGQTVNMTIRIDRELKGEVEAAARKSDRDLSGYVRYALRRTLKADALESATSELRDLETAAQTIPKRSRR